MAENAPIRIGDFSAPTGEIPQVLLSGGGEPLKT
jgi:hypothetical protein